jgi:hypothetical protein
MPYNLNWHMCNILRLLAFDLPFRRAALDLPSRSGNVNFANRQTDRILVPYNKELKNVITVLWNFQKNYIRKVIFPWTALYRTPMLKKGELSTQTQKQYLHTIHPSAFLLLL